MNYNINKHHNHDYTVINSYIAGIHTNISTQTDLSSQRNNTCITYF